MAQDIKIKDIAPVIDTIAGQRRFKSDYYGTKINVWGNNNMTQVRGTFIARQYKNIIELVQETKATCKIEGDILRIIYKQGAAAIYIDEIAELVLLPYLNNYIVTD